MSQPTYFTFIAVIFPTLLLGQEADSVKVHLLGQDPWVPKDELVCLRESFAENIRYGSITSPRQIFPRSLIFPVSEYSSARPTCKIEERAGVIIHHGLDRNHEYDIALEFICLRPQQDDPFSYDFQPAADHFVVRNGHLVKVLGRPAKDWVEESGKRYRESLVLRDTSGTAFEMFNPAVNVDTTIFPVDEIDLLIQNNPQTDPFLKIIPIAEPRTRRGTGPSAIDENIHQGVCWLVLNVELDDKPVLLGSEFKNKGADLGSPCPSYCPPKVSFRSSGVNGCK